MAEQKRAGATGGTSGPAPTSGKPADAPSARPAKPSDAVDAQPSRGSRLGWIALAVAALLTAWQVIYAVNVQTIAETSQDTYTSVSIFVSLILAVVIGVLAIVAISQKARPRWPASASLGIAIFVFLVCVATWIGTLLA